MSVDEFVTRGYKIQSEGENSTRLKERDWGDAEVHLLVAALSGWWTFGFSNAVYAIYKYATAEEIVIKIEDEDDVE